MSETSVRALCAGCGRTYAVPDPTRTYKCKECGGPVAVTRESCAACGAELAAGGTSCAACGAGQVAERAEERRQAAFELERALRAVRWVRIVFALAVLVNGLNALILIGMLPRAPEHSGTLLLGIGQAAVLACVGVVGFRQARLQPFLWSVVVASLATVRLAVVAALEPGAIVLLVVLGLFVAVLWCLVVPAARVRRLIAAHPDLYVAHKLHGTEKRRHASRGAPERSREQFAEAARRTARGSAIWAAGVLLVLGGATAAAWAKARRNALEPRLEEFRTAWSQADAQGVARLSLDSEVEPRRKSLAAQVAALGWDPAWPALGEAEIQRALEQAKVTWPLAEESVRTTWGLGDGGWRLMELHLPLPPIESALDRLVEAWNARDVPALAALYPPDHRDSSERNIARAILRRGWGDAWPELRDASIVPSGERGARVTFRIAGDELIARWRFEDELGWCVTSLNLPD